MSRRPGTLVVKDPDSVEPYWVDWTAYLAELGDGVVVAESTWIVAGNDSSLTATADAIVAGGLLTVAYLTGGTSGTYVVTNRITTNSAPPVTDDRSYRVLVQHK